MNKNKLIFIIGALVVIFFIIFMLNAISGDEASSEQTSSGNTPFVIWTLGDDPIGTQALLNGFKQKYPAYSKTVFNLENFSDYETYTQALSSAIIRGDAPDVFIQNNHETSLLSNQVVAIPNDVINPSDFRKQYKAVFGEDLIISFDEQSEFVTGVPIGYELLGIYYNRKFVKSSDLTSQASLSSTVSSITRQDPDKIGIALGNGSTIEHASDLITQYFMLSGAASLDEVDDTIVKTAMETYFRYGSDSSDNGYDSDVFVELLSTGQNNLDLFSRGDVAMVVGYPRMLDEIAEKGYSDKFLLASYFPHYVGELGKTLVSYNSFVANKDSTQLDTAYSLLQYMSSEEAADIYLDAYPYYLPGLLSLESQRMNRKVNEGYNITLGDFYNSSYELSSFDMIGKSYYESEIVSILDNAPSYRVLFQNLVTQLSCRYTKIVLGNDLSLTCTS